MRRFLCRPLARSANLAAVVSGVTGHGGLLCNGMREPIKRYGPWRDGSPNINNYFSPNDVILPSTATPSNLAVWRMYLLSSSAWN